MAWWVPTWDGWGERTEEQNRALRGELCGRGEYDGYLLYVDGSPLGWCQVGPRDRLEKLTRQFNLAPDPATWAVTCFMIAPDHRRTGMATFLLQEALRDLRRRGIKRVEAYPKRGEDLEAGALWTGPESMYLAAGFSVSRDHQSRPILMLEL